MIIDTEIIIDHQEMNCQINFITEFNKDLNDNEVIIIDILCGGIDVSKLIESGHIEMIKNRCYLAYHRAVVKSMMNRN